MTVRWPKTSYVKIHEGCGGIVAWTEAIGTPGVHFTGTCQHCGASRLPQEAILPIEVRSDTDYRQRIHDMAVDDRAALEWDHDDEFRHNQKRLAEAIEA